MRCPHLAAVADDARALNGRPGLHDGAGPEVNRSVGEVKHAAQHPARAPPLPRARNSKLNGAEWSGVKRPPAPHPALVVHLCRLLSRRFLWFRRTCSRARGRGCGRRRLRPHSGVEAQRQRARQRGAACGPSSRANEHRRAFGRQSQEIGRGGGWRQAYETTLVSRGGKSVYFLFTAPHKSGPDAAESGPHRPMTSSG